MKPIMKQAVATTFLALFAIVAESVGLRAQTAVGVPSGPGQRNNGVSAVGTVEAAPPIRGIEGVRLIRDGLYTVNDPRPLERAAELLQRKTGVTVSYEDAALVAAQDLIAAADYPGNRVLATQNPGWRGPLIPKGGTLDVAIPTGAGSVVDPLTTLEAVLKSHEAYGNPGEFKVVQLSQTEFSIVPVRVRDSAGLSVPQSSPLDTRISFPLQDRTLEETIELIRHSVESATRVPVANGVYASSYFRSTKVRLGAQDETARDVLAKALRIPGGTRFSWQLRYDPQGKGYGLWLHAVEIETPGPNGAELTVPAWPK